METIAKQFANREGLLQDFWENRYLEEGEIWGQNPSLSCEKILKYTNDNPDILIPGIGYGRNAKFFVDKGFKVKGLLAFTVFSEQEPALQYYQNHKQLERNTFQLPNSKIIHFFDEIDLEKHFKNFKILEHILFEDFENHGSLGDHTHKLRLIIAQKN